MQFFAVFSLKLEKKDGNEYEPESLTVMQCSLDRHLKKNCGRNYSILREREIANSKQQLEASAGLRKAKKCLSCFKRSSRRIPLELR